MSLYLYVVNGVKILHGIYDYFSDLQTKKQVNNTVTDSKLYILWVQISMHYYIEDVARKNQLNDGSVEHGVEIVPQFNIMDFYGFLPYSFLLSNETLF